MLAAVTPDKGRGRPPFPRPSPGSRSRDPLLDSPPRGLGRMVMFAQIAPPLAGSVCFPRLAVDGGATELCERSVAEAGVMLLPGTVFDYDDAHVRIGLGRASFREGLAVFEEWLAKRAGGAAGHPARPVLDGGHRD